MVAVMRLLVGPDPGILRGSSVLELSSAWVVFRAWGVFCLGVFRLLGLGCLLLGLSSAWVFVAPHVVVPQKCRTQFPDMYFKR